MAAKFDLCELNIGTRVVWRHGGDEMIGRVANTPIPTGYSDWHVVVTFDDGGCHAVNITSLRRPNALELLADI